MTHESPTLDPPAALGTQAHPRNRLEILLVHLGAIAWASTTTDNKDVASKRNQRNQIDNLHQGSGGVIKVVVRVKVQASLTLYPTAANNPPGFNTRSTSLKNVSNGVNQCNACATVIRSMEASATGILKADAAMYSTLLSLEMFFNCSIDLSKPTTFSKCGANNCHQVNF